MPEATGSTTRNQRRRTRKDILSAAAELLKGGRTPSMDEVAQAALVSRATIYRYFPNVESLIVEAPLDGVVSEPGEFFADDKSRDPVERVERAESALHDMAYRNEFSIRTMLAHSLRPDGKHRERDDVPIRQSRRIGLIEEALAPARDRFDSEEYDRLCAALCLIFGAESMIVFRDVMCLDESEARKVKSWAIRALIRAALRDDESSE